MDKPDNIKGIEVFFNTVNKLSGIEKPCNFDHNGECLVCDCWPLNCAFARHINKDYKYETKEELEQMFPDSEKYKEFASLLKENEQYYMPEQKTEEEIYFLSYAWYEEYSPILLRGPKVENWESYCNSLLPAAAELAVEQANDTWLGWPEIVDAMVSILKEKGYIRLRPDEQVYDGTIIIREASDAIIREASDAKNRLPENALEKIFKHNQAVENRLYKQEN